MTIVTLVIFYKLIVFFPADSEAESESALKIRRITSPLSYAFQKWRNIVSSVDTILETKTFFIICNLSNLEYLKHLLKLEETERREVEEVNLK